MREVEALTKQIITKMDVPTPADIVRHRESQVIENMKVWLGRGRYKRELEIVQELIEAGHEPLNIAAAALKIARADEKQRPIADVSEVKEIRKPDRDSGRSGKRESPGRREDFGRAGKQRLKGAERCPHRRRGRAGARPDPLLPGGRRPGALAGRRLPAPAHGLLPAAAVRPQGVGQGAVPPGDRAGNRDSGSARSRHGPPAR